MRIVKAGRDLRAFCSVVERHCLTKQFLLAAERGVEAGLIDSHSFGQVLHRGAFIAAQPEDPHGFEQRFMPVELSRSAKLSHHPFLFSTGVSLMFRATSNLPRSDERRVGEGCVSTCRPRLSQRLSKTQTRLTSMNITTAAI